MSGRPPTASGGKASGRIYGARDFAGDFAASRETMARLERYAALLVKWQATHNLVSAATLDGLWARHMADAAQLVAHLPQEHPPEKPLRIADIGSGAGFPGLVVAICAGETREVAVDLVESNAKKCAFLRAAVGVTDAPARVLCARAETVEAQSESPYDGPPYDVVTARALAPLARLLELTAHLCGPDTLRLFLKGQDVDSELTEARRSWKVTADKRQSVVDPAGSVLIISEAARV